MCSLSFPLQAFQAHLSGNKTLNKVLWIAWQIVQVSIIFFHTVALGTKHPRSLSTRHTLHFHLTYVLYITRDPSRGWGKTCVGEKPCERQMKPLLQNLRSTRRGFEDAARQRTSLRQHSRQLEGNTACIMGERERRGCCILWSVSWSQQEQNHNRLYLPAYQHNHTTVTRLPLPTPPLSTWSGSSWLMFCDAKGGGGKISSAARRLSSRLPSHVESALRSATDLIFQECVSVVKPTRRIQPSVMHSQHSCVEKFNIKMDHEKLLNVYSAYLSHKSTSDTRQGSFLHPVQTMWLTDSLKLHVTQEVAQFHRVH